MKEPITVYGIDITETVKKQFASGAVSANIYGRVYDGSPSTPCTVIDRDGNVTKESATPDDAET